MGCNCKNDGVPLSLKQKLRREAKEKFAEVRRLWTESKITSDKDQLGFKEIK